MDFSKIKEPVRHRNFGVTVKVPKLYRVSDIMENEDARKYFSGLANVGAFINKLDPNLYERFYLVNYYLPKYIDLKETDSIQIRFDNENSRLIEGRNIYLNQLSHFYGDKILKTQGILSDIQMKSREDFERYIHDQENRARVSLFTVIDFDKTHENTDFEKSLGIDLQKDNIVDIYLKTSDILDNLCEIFKGYKSGTYFDINYLSDKIDEPPVEKAKERNLSVHPFSGKSSSGKFYYSNIIKLPCRLNHKNFSDGDYQAQFDAMSLEELICWKPKVKSNLKAKNSARKKALKKYGITIYSDYFIFKGEKLKRDYQKNVNKLMLDIIKAAIKSDYLKESDPVVYGYNDESQDKAFKIVDCALNSRGEPYFEVESMDWSSGCTTKKSDHKYLVKDLIKVLEKASTKDSGFRFPDSKEDIEKEKGTWDHYFEFACGNAGKISGYNDFNDNSLVVPYISDNW